MLLFFLVNQALCTAEENIYNTVSKDWQVKPVHYFMQGMSIVSHPISNVGPPLVFYLYDKKDIARDGAVGMVSGIVTVYSLKYLINRQRPDGETTRFDSSFPSGHAAFAFTQAVIYSRHYPRLKIPLFLYAVAVGFSRIYLSKHYPTDVLGGAALGIGIGLLTNSLFK